MTDNKIRDALNEQINREFYSAYLYLATAAYFESKNLHGFVHWMRVQAQEEVFHAMKIFDYLAARGWKVELKSVDAPPAERPSPLAAFEAALDHEKLMTRRINELVDLAIAESDHATNNLLQWFVNEQVEEEAGVEDIVQKMKLIGDDGGGLFILDRELGRRTAAPDANDGSGNG